MFSFINNLLVNFKYLALVIQISIVVITIAIISTFLSLIIMICYRYFKYKREKRVERLTPKLEQLIYSYIFFNSSENSSEYNSKEEIITKLSQYLKRKKDKQLCIEKLIGTKKTISGNVRESLLGLFIESKLQTYSLKKLFKRRKYKVIQGLSEFLALDAPLADVYIIPLTHSTSRSVRIMARHAYVKLSKNNPFNFFDSNKEELLVWEQIELFDIITTNEKLIVPNFSSWISYSKNKSIIKFCLKLVEHYHQTEAIPSVLKLLSTDDHKLRVEAIKCLGNMQVKESEVDLMNIYNEQPIFCQIEILEAMSKIRSGMHVQFLSHELQTGSEFNLRKAAAKALVINTKDKTEVLNDILNNVSKEQEVMLNHYLNPLTA